jgi:signal transduction histidine kinase
MPFDFEAVLRHARALQQATTLRDLLAVTRTAVQQVAGYEHVWLALFDPATPEEARILAVSGEIEPVVLEECPTIPVAGDPMMEEIVRALAPVVVDDARVDPRTNKEIVARVGNRTLINVPLLLGGASIGCLGTGTFGDEVRPPTASQVDALVLYATQLAAAFERVRMLDQHLAVVREREHLQRRLETLQRVESVALLASGVAHDFNNHLTVIFAALDGLSRSTQLTPSEHARVDDASHAALQARGLARQLLTMGRRSNERAPLHLEERVRSVIELVASSMPRGIVVTQHCRPARAVHADPSQLDQVLTNLVLNARDAMGERGALDLTVDEAEIGEGEAALLPWAHPGAFVRVTVADTGPGMSAEVLEHVFEPFFTTKRTGTGMGLAIVSRVMRQHEGLLNCVSQPGHGTTFELYFPIRERLAS